MEAAAADGFVLVPKFQRSRLDRAFAGWRFLMKMPKWTSVVSQLLVVLASRAQWGCLGAWLKGFSQVHHLKN